ncbi:MAG: presenilin family intramembrane aspartyl protease [Candidatus Aenigmarchaeota archaeon]
MKHTFSITVLMVLIFFLSQIIGLYALNVNTKVTQTPEGQVIVEHEDTAIGKRPEIYGPETFAYMLVAILIGTGLILLLVRFKKISIWKALFFFSVWMTCSITIGVFINSTLALVLCIFLAFFKVYKPNIWVHNFTELFIYAGIAIIFVPLLDIVWAVLLLLAISAYDMFAVWKSRHMIRLAEFQTKSRAFAGVMLSYKIKVKEKIEKAKEGGKKAKEIREEFKSAILGGGDIAFPMIFAGVVMDSMIKGGVLAKNFAFLQALIIPVIVTVFLFFLLTMAKKDRFYPAMPFLTAGCLIGYGLVWLINFAV